MLSEGDPSRAWAPGGRASEESPFSTAELRTLSSRAAPRATNQRRPVRIGILPPEPKKSRNVKIPLPSLPLCHRLATTSLRSNNSVRHLLQPADLLSPIPFAARRSAPSFFY